MIRESKTITDNIDIMTQCNKIHSHNKIKEKLIKTNSGFIVSLGWFGIKPSVSNGSDQNFH